MNKLKLRAWDDVLKEMLYSKVEQFDDAILFRFEKHFETEKPVYLRYTGIEDRNDVDVYEGDILLVELRNWFGNLVDEFVVAVIFRDCRFIIVKNMDELGLFNTNAAKLEDYCDFPYKVIGNIYEHPELLTRKYHFNE